MISRIKKFFNRNAEETTKEIEQLRTELAVIRSMADDELRGMITDIKFDTMISISELRQRVAKLERSGVMGKRSKTTQEFILSYLMNEGDNPNPSDILKH
jgi:hypothetical protein